MKTFFKSNAFKCIATLLCIVLISGVLLTVCNALFYVSDAERAQRAINKIYGESKQVTAVTFEKEDGNYGTATALEAYLDEDGNYLIKSKGTGGYKGTVTCWVLVEMQEGNISRVKKVIIETSDGETLLNNINYLNKFPATDYTEGFTYESSGGFMSAGATLSSNAINNAVNGAVTFIKRVVFGEQDPYKNFVYYSFINMTATTWVASGTDVVYTIITKPHSHPAAFTVEVTVNAEKKITAFDLVTDGSTSTDYSAKLYNTANFIGKTQADLLAMIGEDGEAVSGGALSTGATRSNESLARSALFAVANYDYCLANPVGGEA